MWFPLIHTTITHISNFIFGHHDLRPENHKQIPFKNRDFTQPGSYLISPLIPSIPINARVTIHRPKFLINEQRES